jgi:filamentous hemagglutinin family protein
MPAMRIRQLLALTLAIAQGLGIGTAWAIPQNGAVVAGGAIINQQGNILTITNTPGTIINWGGFSIGAGETARFVQQNSSSGVLNRVVGQDPSLILGALQSNGRVFLVNPNGVVFGAGSRVDVNGLVASSLDITNDDFRAGRLRFDATSANPGAVRNEGAITTPSGGNVYLIAPSVENSGVISSPQGEVVLAAGRQVQLVDSRDPDLHVVVSAPGDQAMNLGRILSQGGSIGIYGALVNQRGVVDADSAIVGENGRIVFKASDTTLLEAGSLTTARGAGEGGSIHVLGDHVGLTGDARVDASGRTGGGTVLVGGDRHGGNAAIANASATYVGAETSIRADALGAGNGGRVIVWSNGATRAYGSISARGGEAAGNGGFSEVSGASYLDYRGRADLRAPYGNAGTLLLDPNDITIQAGPASGSTTGSSAGPPFTFSGGPASSILTVTDLQNQLALGNVTVSTSGGSGGPLGGAITVASAIGWTSGGFLTLDADNGIAINGAISTPGDGRLLLTSRGGTISQTAPINSTYLVINSLGDVLLDGATNNVGVIAAQVGDATHLNHNFSFLNGASLLVSSLSGVTGITIATSGAYSPGAPDGVISLRTTSGDITQFSAPLSAKAAYLEANNVTLTDVNFVGAISGMLNGGASSHTFAFSQNGGDLTVTSVAGRNGIQAGNGDVSLAAIDGNLSLASPVTTGGGAVTLNAIGAVSGSLSGLAISASAGNGIALTTQTQSISASNSGGSSGISIANTGALTVGNVNDSGTGPISISTSGPLTINGPVATPAGAITLAAGPTGNATDDLTVNGSIATAPASGIAVSTSGPIVLKAGDAITVNGTIAGNVTQQPNLNPAPPPPPGLPSLSQCIANPALAGCDQVLPTVSQCAAQPTLAGCAQVLPTLAQCTATPTLIGCGAVLPTVAQCVATPSLPGCSVVLPTIAACTATPTLAGCSLVLPTLAQCVATPSLPGCSAVLPTLTQCIATPTLAGCAAVLPTIAQCVLARNTAGCAAVLPSLAQCVATPGQPGCSVVLPTLAQCVATPALAGCSVVLPTLAQCVATPTLSGCGAVLPSIAQCAASPTLAGCSIVLPPISNAPNNPNNPVTQAINNTVDILNRTTMTTTSSSGTTKTNGPSNLSTTGKDDKTDKNVASSDKSGVKNDAAKKMYCN